MPFDLRSYFNLERGRRSTTVIPGIVVSVSLANLCYLRIWDLLLHDESRNYLTATPYDYIDYLAALLGVIFLAGFFYGLISIVWHHGSRWWRIVAMLGVFVVFLFPLDFVRRSSGIGFEGFAGTVRYVIIGGGVLALLTLAITFRHKFFAVLFWLLAILSPYAVFNIGHALFYIISPVEIYQQRVLPERPSANPTSSRRLVWIIFDEWDQTALFERRPPDLKLPVLDALIADSVVATRAFAPAAMTKLSIPALLSGRVISEAQGTADSRLRIRFSGADEWRTFRDVNTIVTDALERHQPTAVYGWYHPYDRILPLSPKLKARSFGFPGFDAIQGLGLWRTIGSQYAFLALPVYGRMVCRDLYRQFHVGAVDAAADPTLQFVFLHYGIPHPPGIYDADKQEFSITMRGETTSYTHNLALVDRTLGELLAALEAAGLRQSTSLILTSDHWWRSAPWVGARNELPVPLIIQARPGDLGVRIEGRFLTTGLRSIANAILAGQLCSNADIAAELAGDVTTSEIRYVKGVAEIY